MTQESYSRTISVAADPDAVYRAVTREISGWWGEQSKPFEAVGDIAAMTFDPNPTTWTFRARTLEPGRTVELECIDADHIHDGAPDSIRKEWVGTTLAWRIAPAGGKTEVVFTHDGLRPGLGCYDICVAGWDHFITSSLKSYLDGGSGTPGHAEL